MKQLGCFQLALLIATAAVTSPAVLRAAEIHSNGTGGGPWSESATWRGKAVPGPDDTVTISAHDAVTFDRDDTGKQTCRDLYIDPKGTLIFKPGGKRVMVLVGPLESYGLIKLDAAGSAETAMELRFVGPAAQRQLKVAKGGALLVSGRPGLPGGKRNIILSSQPTPATQPAPAGGPAAATKGKPAAVTALPATAPAPSPPIPATELLTVVTCASGSALDVRQAQLAGITLRASKIDNTGAKNNERVNVADCAFTAAGSIALDGCDTPAVVNNSFDHAGGPIAVSAIAVNGCPLAEIRGNAISGKYAYGLTGDAQTDTVVTGNSISGCTSGVRWAGANDMLKGLTIRGADVGVLLNAMTGALEDITFDDCKTGLSISTATFQATSLRFKSVPRDGVRISFTRGSATLVNCDVTPEQITMTKAARPAKEPRVTAMQFCVVAVKGRVPAGVAVTATADKPANPLPAGAMDLNVLNAPAALDGRGLTPLPKSLQPLILKSWEIEGDGKIKPASVYNVSVIARPDKPDGEPKKLKMVTATPDASWYRADGDDSKATLEIVLP